MKSKPLLLTAFVVVTFILYSLQQRHEGSGTVIAPVTTTKPSTSQTTPATGSGSSSTGQSTASAAYKDGTYTGTVADAFYGNVQVQATIAGGKITTVKFLSYPNDQDNSVRINQQAIPYLQQEAIQAQSAQVDIVSGATDTSSAFIQSLGAALQKAQTG
jgi:uncharacterized protein with FMN-binding domain